MIRAFVSCVVFVLASLAAPANAQAFAGSVYQVVDTTDGTDLNKDARIKTVRAYLKSGWDAASLSGAQKVGATLYSSSFYLPSCKASAVPFCFQFSPCHERKYANIVIFEGCVEAPKSGWFRFVGTGDDMLLVNFGGKTVLEGGYRLVSGKKIQDGMALSYQKQVGRGGYATALMLYPGALIWNKELGGLTCGLPFEVEQGKVYQMKILYVDMAGGAGYGLFLEHLKNRQAASKGIAKIAKGQMLDLFRLSEQLPDEADCRKLLGRHAQSDGGWVRFNPDSLIWTPTTQQPNATIGGDGSSHSIGNGDSDEDAGSHKKKSKKQKSKKKGKKKGNSFREL